MVQTQGKPRKKIISFLLKLIFSLSLIVFFILRRNVDLKDTVHSLSNFNFYYLPLIFGFHLIALMLNSLRWDFLLKVQRIDYPLMKLFQYYLVGNFFGIFLPGRIGGDVVRIMDTGRQNGSRIESTAVIIMERGIGLFTLVVLAFISILMPVDVGIDLTPIKDQLWVATAVFMTMVALILLLLFRPAVMKPFIHFFKIRKYEKPYAILKRFFNALRIYNTARTTLIKAFLLGFVIHFLYIVSFYFVGRALGFNSAGFFFYLFLMPIRTILVSMPLFIGGFGVREAVDIHFFTKLPGIVTEQALSYSWITAAFYLFWGLVGALFYIARKSPASRRSR